MNIEKKRAGRMRRLMLAFLGALSLAGCGQFFTKLPAGGSTGNSADNLYVVNNQSASATVAGFSIGTSTLTALSNSPYAGAQNATCVALTPNNNFLFIGTGQNGIFLYTVNADGSLTLGNNKVAVATGIIPTSMVVDTTGAYLIVSGIGIATGPQVLAYSINTTTGILGTQVASIVQLSVGAPTHIFMNSINQFIYVPLGTGGFDTLTFSSTTGALAKLQHFAPLNPQGADQAVATDPNGKYLFVAETGSTTSLGLRQFTIGTDGTLTELAGSPFATGLGPSAVLVDATGSYLYVANSTNATITAYLLSSNGALTTISGSPFLSVGTSPIDMIEDNSKSYIAVVNSSGKPNLQLFKFDATIAGKLDPVANAATGASPLAIAATH